MFSVLVTEAFGASAAIQAHYLIERRLDTPTGAGLVLQVRERTTGIRRWLKCADGGATSAEALAREQQVLSRLQHTHLLLPLPASPVEDELCLIYPWRAEKPLSDTVLAQVAPSDQVRLVQALLETLTYLHGLEQPVLHGSPLMEHIWAVPQVFWLRLSGFSGVREGATAAELANERQAFLKLSWRVLGRGDADADLSPQLLESGEQWVAEPLASFAKLNAGLKQEFLSRVTADL